MAWYIIKQFGGQVAFLAPTEVLARQHFATLSKLFLPLGVKVELLIGALTAKQKEQVKAKIAQGHVDIVVGTHALIQEDVQFRDLQLAIVDEQHKFGVNQRAFFKSQGSPHIVQLSATPIPRSLALAFFGEFKVSVIDQMPEGRKPIITKIITQDDLEKNRMWFVSKLNQGEQIFVITPLIEESQVLDEVASATQEYEQMKQLFPEFADQIGLLH